MATQPVRITSRSNPVVARLRKLSTEPAAYRRFGELLLEGEHLCAAWVARQQGRARVAVVTESGWTVPTVRELAGHADSVVVVAADIMAGLSALDSATALVFLVDAPAPSPLQSKVPTVVLDAVQDPGNVGTIIRSAAAFGFEQVIALDGTAALWSPKVVRAGMGAHFALRLVEGGNVAALDAIEVPLYGTSSHAEVAIDRVALAWPCAWVLGHEGGGVSSELQARCARTLRIPQPGGEESLNVGAAAAVCLYESARQRASGARQ